MQALLQSSDLLDFLSQKPLQLQRQLLLVPLLSHPHQPLQPNSFSFGTQSSAPSQPSLYGNAASSSSAKSTTVSPLFSTLTNTHASAPASGATAVTSTGTSNTTSGLSAAAVSTGSALFSFSDFASATTSVMTSSGTATCSFTGFSLSSISPASTSKSQTQPVDSSAPLISVPASAVTLTTTSSTTA
ncbi:uncharacterized protein LOC133705272 [Populus nigra]|uniref:uncharacterized protein LOC133705272 n=1 Tax=Populus nigra TaxID=3691 RepID=UPI002B270C6D|nr:uncharacterized protein LOC133705272 [Populus nigra]